MADAQTARALEVARELVRAGVPVFVAPPDPTTTTGYRLPRQWETSTPNLDVVERWRPGWALCAVMGHALDLVDVDPRNGGDATVAGLMAGRAWPRSYARAATPSGGTHDFVAPLRVGSRDGIAPGLDVKGGKPDGTSRGFAFIAPTVRVSKLTGQPTPYQWVIEPDTGAIDTGDDTGATIADMVVRSRGGTAAGKLPTPDEVLGLERHTGPIKDGTRHRQLVSYAGRLRARGLNLAEATVLYRRRWSECEQPPAARYELTWPDALSKLHDAFGRYPAGDVDQGEDVDQVDEAGPSRLERLRAALVDTAGLESLPEPDPLIHGVLFRDTIVFVIGAPGEGKSLVVLDATGHVATGQTWHTFPVSQGSVLYLIAEGVHGVKPRVRAWEQAAGQSMTGVTFLPVAVQAASDGEWSALCELAAEMRPAIIVLDTQARITVGMDENSARDMGVFIERVERLRRACGACIIVVHHTPRGGENPRGSTALEGAADTIIRVSKDDQTLSVTCRKQKDAAPFDDFELRLIPTGSSVIVGWDSNVDSGRTLSAAAWAAVSAWWTQHETDWVSVSTLVDTKTLSKASFYRWAKPLERTGIVESKGDGPARRYRLTRQPDNLTVSRVSSQSQESQETAASTGVRSLTVSPVLRSGTGETPTPAGDPETLQDPMPKWAADAYDREA